MNTHVQFYLPSKGQILDIPDSLYRGKQEKSCGVLDPGLTMPNAKLFQEFSYSMMHSNFMIPSQSIIMFTDFATILSLLSLHIDT